MVKGESMTFKEYWEKTDEKCPECGAVTKRVRGITKQNLKRLIIPRWDMTELTITLLLIFLIILGYSYKSETQMTREWIKEMYDSGNKTICNMVCSQKCNVLEQTYNYTAPQLNLTEYNSLMNIS